MSDDDLTLDDALALLEERAPSNVVVEFLAKGVIFTDIKGFCSLDGCRSPAYIKVDGQYRCLMHAFREVCGKLKELQ